MNVVIAIDHRKATWLFQSIVVKPRGYSLLVSPHARSTTLEEELDDEDLAMMPKKDITLVHIATLDELVSVSLSTTTTHEESMLKINISPTTNTLYDN